MRKDYVEVSADHAAADEAAFVKDFWTEHWDQRSELPRLDSVTTREEYRLMEPFLRGLPAGSRILDGGCGLGTWTVFLTRRGFDVTGLDISERTVGRLKDLWPGHHFVCGDIRCTGLPDASFDAYFSWGTFEHFENGLGECVDEAWRILKPGGLLFVTVPFHNWRHLLRDGRGVAAPDAGSTRVRRAHRFYQWRLTRSELRTELELEGFEVLALHPIGKKTGATQWLVTSAPGLRKGSPLFALARRLLSGGAPALYLGHMLWAAGRKPHQPRDGGQAAVHHRRSP